MCKKSTLNIIFIFFIFQLLTSCIWFDENKQPKQRTPTSDSDTSEISSLIASFEAASTNEQKIEILGSFKNLGEGAKDAVPKLINELKSKDPDYLDEVVNTLGMIGPAAEEAIPALIECFDKDEDCNDWIMLSTIFALGKIGINSEVAGKFLVKKLTNPEITKYSDLPFRLPLFKKKLDTQILDAIDENVLILENLTIPILFESLKLGPQKIHDTDWLDPEYIYQFFLRIKSEKFLNICLKYFNDCTESSSLIDLLEQNKHLANDFILHLINIISSPDVQKPIKAAAITAFQYTGINSEAIITIRNELRNIEIKIDPLTHSDGQAIIDSSIGTLAYFSDQAKPAVPEIINILLAGYYLLPSSSSSAILTEHLSDKEGRDLVKKLEFFLLNNPTHKAIPIILGMDKEYVIQPYIDYLNKKISKTTTSEELLSIYHIEFLKNLGNEGLCPSSKKIIPIIIESLKKIYDESNSENFEDLLVLRSRSLRKNYEESLLKDPNSEPTGHWVDKKAESPKPPLLNTERKKDLLALALSDSLNGIHQCMLEKQDQDSGFLSKVEANEAVKSLIQIYKKIKVYTRYNKNPLEEYPNSDGNTQTRAEIKLNILKALEIFSNFSDNLVPEITILLSNSPSWDLFRIEVIKIIGEIGKSNKALIDEMLRRIKVDIIPGDQEKNPAFHATIALSKLSLDTRDVVITLIDAIKDKSPENLLVRLAGVMALGNAKAFASDAIPALQEALKDQEKIVQESAQTSLNKIK